MIARAIFYALIGLLVFGVAQCSDGVLRRSQTRIVKGSILLMATALVIGICIASGSADLGNSVAVAFVVGVGAYVLLTRADRISGP